jgi:hypothetical protein
MAKLFDTRLFVTVFLAVFTSGGALMLTCLVARPWAVELATKQDEATKVAAARVNYCAAFPKDCEK